MVGAANAGARYGAAIARAPLVDWFCATLAPWTEERPLKTLRLWLLGVRREMPVANRTCSSQVLAEG
jgi:hypothetical protein